MPKEFGDLALDVSAGVAQDMQECLVLSMNVCHKVLGAFGQIQDSFQVDDFGACAVGIGECLREYLQ